ncbi:hypothetical protein [Thermoflexibacter ruber]|uniref:Uncharacterized protein n=1 Tax=Thermoflexibacter ruber TaxID=1003 RepID=A0A1I2DNY9_9BACT|nr:hypothetical protein [Thermoflexibacter ruber]SFE82342.1 hypothetical protein SAMN04488541_1007110 [Thermoflexibacter ruber]
MKKYYSFLFILVSAYLLFSCGSGSDSGRSDKNTDVYGEADSLSYHQGRKTDNLARAVINGRKVEFKYIDAALTIENVIPFTQSKDGRFTSFSFELGSDEKLREKIGIMLINHNITADNIPYQIMPGKQEGKQAKLDLNIQKSSIFISYNNTDNFTCSITAFSDDEIEGNFFGEVRNAGGRIIKVEDGYFKVKIKKVEMKLQ